MLIVPTSESNRSFVPKRQTLFSHFLCRWTQMWLKNWSEIRNSLTTGLECLHTPQWELIHSSGPGRTLATKTKKHMKHYRQFFSSRVHIRPQNTSYALQTLIVEHWCAYKEPRKWNSYPPCVKVGFRFLTLAHWYEVEKYNPTWEKLYERVSNNRTCLKIYPSFASHHFIQKKRQKKCMKTVMWRVFTSRPRTFLCVRLHSCGGGAIQGFDWIVRSGLAKALGCRLQRPDSTATTNAAAAAAAASGRHPSEHSLFGCVRTWLDSCWTWSMTSWSCGCEMGGATMWVGRSERYPGKAHGTLWLFQAPRMKKEKIHARNSICKTDNEWACSPNTRYDSVLTRDFLYLTLRCVTWSECN